VNVVTATGHQPLSKPMPKREQRKKAKHKMEKNKEMEKNGWRKAWDLADLATSATKPNKKKRGKPRLKTHVSVEMIHFSKVT
jgi:hypothetical protein